MPGAIFAPWNAFQCPKRAHLSAHARCARHPLSADPVVLDGSFTFFVFSITNKPTGELACGNTSRLPTGFSIAADGGCGKPCWKAEVFHRPRGRKPFVLLYLRLSFCSWSTRARLACAIFTF